MKISSKRTDNSKRHLIPAFAGKMVSTQFILEDNGVDNDDGIVIISNCLNQAGEKCVVRMALTKEEATQIVARIQLITERSGKNWVKEVMEADTGKGMRGAKKDLPAYYR